MTNFLKVKYLILIILLSGVSTAQSKYELKMRVKASSLDDKRQIVLYDHGELEEFYDGYIIFPSFMDKIQGGMQKGGFSFIDYTGLESIFEMKKQREELAKNRFPLGDLQVFANGFNADKVLSFRIIPEFVNEEDDTVSLFIKYVLYDFKGDQPEYFNWDAKINLYYKLIRIPLNKEIPFQFFDDKLSDYKLSVFLSKIEHGKDLIQIKDDKLFEAIKKAEESCKPISKKFRFDLNFGKTNSIADDAYSSFLFAPKGETQANINMIDVENFNAIEFNSEKIALTNNLYYAKIVVPFVIQNEAKAKKYKNYSTRNKIFTSEYNVYFLPVAIEDDSLVGDLFITIEKLKIGDEIERWSPIQKRVKMKMNKRNTNSISTNRYYASLMFQLPKENWSAFFSRNGEKYEIYGYADYERFINEYIYISISENEVLK